MLLISLVCHFGILLLSFLFSDFIFRHLHLPHKLSIFRTPPWHSSSSLLVDIFRSFFLTSHTSFLSVFHFRPVISERPLHLSLFLSIPRDFSIFSLTCSLLFRFRFLVSSPHFSISSALPSLLRFLSFFLPFSPSPPKSLLLPPLLSLSRRLTLSIFRRSFSRFLRQSLSPVLL